MKYQANKMLTKHWTYFSIMFLFLRENNCKEPCDFRDTVNITDGIFLPNGSYIHEGVLYKKQYIGTYDYILYNNFASKQSVPRHKRGCICLLKPCVQLCCDKNQMLNGTCMEIKDKYNSTMNITTRDGSKINVDIYKHFKVIFGKPCPVLYFLEPSIYPEDEFELNENGEVIRLDDNATIPRKEYCLSPQRDKTTFIMTPNLCMQENITSLKRTLSIFSMCISIPFFLITILVYLLIPELRNLHGKILSCYLSGLVVGYSLLVYPFVVSDITSPTCEITGFTGYFAFMSSFFWLSLIGFDLWRNFQNNHGTKATENTRFWLYSLYAWGIPFGLLCILIIIKELDVPTTYKHGIGEGQYCWIDPEKWINLLYFYGIILLVIMFNTILFALTWLKIRNVQNEIIAVTADNNSSRSLRKEKHNFALFLRLFIVMGVTWSMESISWFFWDSEDELNWYFICTDLCNALQGLIIFVLFICRHRVKQLIVHRFNKLRYSSAKRFKSSACTSSGLYMDTVNKN